LPDTVISVEGLSVERGGRLVLSGLTFGLFAGETVLVSGRNGAGKSTLLRAIAGLLQPSAGHIRYRLASDEVRGVETIHYLGYEDALKPSLTVRENLAFWAAMLGTTRDAPDVEDALAQHGLAHLVDVPAAYLSAGQKRRIALARLLLAPRPVWLLDEPLIALDTAAQAQTIDLMAAHRAGGGAILVASHQPVPGAGRELDLDRLHQRSAVA
jgi:heme exporter protein A